MIKCIASDIDGTLLTGNRTSLSPRLFELIQALKERGICFTAASGRQYASLRAIFEPVKDDISYISENGSLCIHNGNILSTATIDRPLGMDILNQIREYGKCECILSCQTKMYTDSSDAKFVRHLTEELKYDVEVIDDLRNIAEDFLKIAIFNEHGTSEMERYFTDHFKDQIKMATSGNAWMDFIAPGGNKANGLAALLSHLQIDPADCVAFGDQYNDVEMLQFAGTSYAMSTAAPGIAYYSTYVTDSVEEVLEDILAGTKIPRP